MYKDEPQYAVKKAQQYTQLNEPCDVEPSTIAESCLKSLHSSTEKLDYLTKRLGEKISPICSSDRPCGKTEGGAEREYPTYFTELRAVNSQLEKIAEYIESLLDRCEL